MHYGLSPMGMNAQYPTLARTCCSNGSKLRLQVHQDQHAQGHYQIGP